MLLKVEPLKPSAGAFKQLCWIGLLVIYRGLLTILDSAQRKYLKGLAHSLQPIVLVGKGGISDGLREEIVAALESHELIKVKFNEFKAEKTELANKVSQTVGAELVQIIGNIAVLYKPSVKTENRKIKLPQKKVS